MKRKLAVSASLLALLVAAPAMAQTAGTQATNAAPNSADIVVTATREKTLLSKTPIAMSAISGDALRSHYIARPARLTTAAPEIHDEA